MDTQQIITLLLVLAAAIYLGRLFVQSLRSLFSKQGGCAGCSKCSFAPKEDVFGDKPSAPSRRANVIPLTEIRSRPGKHDAGPKLD